NARLKGRPQLTAEQRNSSTEQRQDLQPQHHRAFVVPPHARDAIEQRLGAVTVLHDVEYGEVVVDMRDDQRKKRQRHEHELHQRTRSRHRDPTRLAALSSDQRNDGLNESRCERQDKGEVTELDDHLGFSPSRHTPRSFSARATSGGMYFSSCLASTLSALK